MELFPPDLEPGLALARRVDPKYAPVFANLPDRERAALALYFLPHRSAKEVLGVTRPRVLKWYCPFADQRAFPSGHRYCINVYVGCGHACTYCYAAGYEPTGVACKQDFAKGLRRDLAELERHDVPPAPVHLSNSTDPFQVLEARHGHTAEALELLAAQRSRFTTVVLLTKNPALAAEPAYVERLRPFLTVPDTHPRLRRLRDAGLPGLRLEVSLAFADDAARAFYDPGAPSVQQRRAAIVALRRAGLPVVLRIDPLLPREPLPRGLRLADFGLPPAQSPAALDELLAFAADLGVLHVVYSAAKVVKPRGRGLAPPMTSLKALYEALAAPARLNFRGGSWRLPGPLLRELVTEPFCALARRHGLTAKFCKQNLLSTP